MIPSLLETANNRLMEGDFEKAFSCLKDACETDDRAEAHRLLGLYGLEGLFPSLSETQSLAHLETAANLGDAIAIVELYLRTKQTSWRECVVPLSKQGNLHAVDALARLDAEEFFRELGYVTGMDLLKAAVAKDHLDAMLLYAKTLEEDRRKDEAKDVWRRAAVLGSPQAHFELARLSPNPAIRESHWKAAAKHGHIESLRYLERLYAEAEDWTKRKEILMQLAEHKDARSLQRLYEDSIETGDVDKAIHYLSLFPMDEAKRSYQLARLYHQIHDEEEAIHQLGIAAEKGHLSAMYELGICFQTGRGVIPNPSLAVHWIAKAAERCHPEAIYKMGCLYEAGEGVPKDERLAAFWFDHAASYGHKEAKLRLRKTLKSFVRK